MINTATTNTTMKYFPNKVKPPVDYHKRHLLIFFTFAFKFPQLHTMSETNEIFIYKKFGSDCFTFFVKTRGLKLYTIQTLVDPFTTRIIQKIKGIKKNIGVKILNIGSHP